MPKLKLTVLSNSAKKPSFASGVISIFSSEREETEPTAYFGSPGEWVKVACPFKNKLLYVRRNFGKSRGLSLVQLRARLPAATFCLGCKKGQKKYGFAPSAPRLSGPIRLRFRASTRRLHNSEGGEGRQAPRATSQAEEEEEEQGEGGEVGNDRFLSAAREKLDRKQRSQSGHRPFPCFDTTSRSRASSQEFVPSSDSHCCLLLNIHRHARCDTCAQCTVL